MSYIVIELQTTNGTTSNIVTTHATRQEAESKYHLILSAAAVSNVPLHAATILTADGFQLMYQAYTHEAAEA